MQLFLQSFPGDKLVSHGEDGEAIKKTFLQGLGDPMLTGNETFTISTDFTNLFNE